MWGGQCFTMDFRSLDMRVFTVVRDSGNSTLQNHGIASNLLPSTDSRPPPPSFRRGVPGSSSSHCLYKNQRSCPLPQHSSSRTISAKSTRSSPLKIALGGGQRAQILTIQVFLHRASIAGRYQLSGWAVRLSVKDYSSSTRTPICRSVSNQPGKLLLACSAPSIRRPFRQRSATTESIIITR